MARTKKQSTEAAVREIRRRTRRKFAPEEKVRIVLEGLRGEQSISELCRRELLVTQSPPHEIPVSPEGLCLGHADEIQRRIGSGAGVGTH